jgi:cytochrome P450
LLDNGIMALLELANLLDPYPLYREWHRAGPVHWDDGIEAWVVTGYHEGHTVLRENSVFCSDWRRIGENTPQSLLGIQTLDPPEHTRIRHLMVEGLKAVGATRSLDRLLAAKLDEVLADLEQRPSFDFVREFAEPLALAAVTHLLGAPPVDRDWFVPLSNTIVDGMDAGLRPECYEPGVAARARLTELVGEWLAAPPAGGLIAHLLESTTTDELNRDVLLNTVRVILQAGFQTANRFLAFGMHTLLRVAPDRRRPVDSEVAVHELVRFDGPVHAESRGCVRDVELGGEKIRCGQEVTVLLGAANRDPAVFDRPDTLILDRAPNRHLGFGRGPHSCLGAPFAVQLATAAFTALTHRYPDAELLREPVPRPNVTERGLTGLQISLRAPRTR